jgi:hypothetical protein
LTQERVSKYMGTRRRRRRLAWDTILGVGKIFAGAVDVEVGEGQQVGGAEGHLDVKATARDARRSGGVREVGDVAPHVKKTATWGISALKEGRRHPGECNLADGGHSFTGE